MNDDESITKANFAREIGVSKARVSQLVKLGPPVLSDGRLDCQEALTWYQSNIRLTAKRVAANGAPGPTAKLSHVPAPSVSASSGLSAAQRYQAARAQNEENKARLSSLDLESRSGRLVSVEHVKRAVFETYRCVRDRLLALPDRLAARLAATDDPVAVHDLLTAELESALLTVGEGKLRM